MMDLSRPVPPSSIFPAGGGPIVLPRHPATPPSSVSPPTKVPSSQPSSNGATNAKTAFFSISNLVNGLRQQHQESSAENSPSKGKKNLPLKWVFYRQQLLPFLHSSDDWTARILSLAARGFHYFISGAQYIASCCVAEPQPAGAQCC